MRPGYVTALVDSTSPQRNMKSIDLPFTLDSFEHKACDVSVANLQSQYIFLYITLTCKEKEKREKEIPVISDSGVAFSSELCCWRGQAGSCVYYLMDLKQWKGKCEGDEGWGKMQRSQPEREAVCGKAQQSLWVRKMRAMTSCLSYMCARGSFLMFEN